MYVHFLLKDQKREKKIGTLHSVGAFFEGILKVYPIKSEGQF